MPKPRGRRAGSKARRGAPAKRAAKAPVKKGQKAKRALAKRRVVPPKKRGRARAPAKPKAPVPKPAPKPAAPSQAVAAPPVVPPPKRVERKEATRMADQAKCPIHNSPECFKPALDAYIQKAYDGYCTKIDWPFVRIIPKGWKPG
jgi:hypothetical protein